MATANRERETMAWIPLSQAAALANVRASWITQLAARGRIGYKQTPLGRLYSLADIGALAHERRLHPNRGRPRKEATRK